MAASAWRAEASMRIAASLTNTRAASTCSAARGVRSSCAPAREHGAFGAEDVDQHVGEVHQHFLLVGELLSVGLHRQAEHHQRRLLERVDGAPLLGQRRVVALERQRRRPEQLVLQRLRGGDDRRRRP